jgi:hypothetical protein
MVMMLPGLRGQPGMALVASCRRIATCLESILGAR